MKLLAKTNTYYLIFLVILAPVMIAVDYYLIRYIINDEVNEKLIHESERIKYYLAKEGEIPRSNYLFDLTPMEEASPNLNRFNDTLIFESYAERLIPYRTYEFSAQVGAEKLKVSLRHLLLEMNKLILWLFAATTFILILLATGLFFINHKIFNWTLSRKRLHNYQFCKQ